MLEKFLKQYWFNIALVIVTVTFVFYIIPVQEKNYLSPDIALVKRNTNIAVIAIELVLIIALLFFIGRNSNTLKQLFNLLANLIFIGLGFYFLLSPLFLSAAYFINTLSRNPVKKMYIITHVDNHKKHLLLSDDITKNSINGDILLVKNNNVKLNVNDKILVYLDKGLLGINHSPQLETK